ncbi:MBL fold metallo-hydrolase [Phragmitibacter flavus]|uniref:MBL fold metallo-hydrolase n=1 Tax=Phragmitibacter flavus TaxID=2576071 RepID=A0A5R8KIW3_9BACT|nr:MBL fold metallo-hydrolase [Phragmitibacter flavus]TLD72197.1 MBL fold metallo-hydrolase [Phragmitibacter flavus]
MLPLEDLFNDIINKAQRGLGLSNEALAQQADVALPQLLATKDGEINETVIRLVSPVLHLHAPSLLAMAHQNWHPRPVELPGLAQFNTPFDDMTVNAYIVWDSSTREAVAFDSGATAEPMIKFLSDRDLVLKAVYLTHTHPDHIADLATLRENDEPLFASAKEPWQGATLFDCGQTFTHGKLRIETRQTTGHSIGATTYVIHGLANPVAIVGDALFASSMGGGAISFTEALATNRSEIFTLPDHTILCPGHGPLTTVGEEKNHNPFYPEFK